MGNLLTLIFVVLVIVLGIGACWAITANGAATATTTDSFGDAPPAQSTTQSEAAGSTAVATMPVLLIGFFVMICVILVASFAWLWNTGKSKASKY